MTAGLGGAWGSCVGLLLVLISTPLSAETAAGPGALAWAGDRLVVAETLASRLTDIDAVTGSVQQRMALPGRPAAVVVARDGTRYVALAEPVGRIAVVRAGRVERLWPCGHTPSALALSPDELFLVVAERFDTTVAVLDIRDGHSLRRQRVQREPVALAVTPDGRRVVVANLVPTGRSDQGGVAAMVSILDTAGERPARQLSLAEGSSAVRGVAVSPDGQFAYLTHQVARYQVPATQLERGWMMTNAISVLDLGAERLLATVLLDDVAQGAANPWAVVATPERLVVALAGSQEVCLIDRQGLHRRLAEPGVAERAVDDLGFLAPLRQRIPAGVLGPRALLVQGSRLWIAGCFSDDVARLDLDAADKVPRITTLGPGAGTDPVQRGEMAFNDARRCFQTWQSCASCHVDARSDALDWDLVNDGLGNPKNTKGLVMSHDTPPVMWLGGRPDTATSLRASFRSSLYHTVDDATANDVEAFLASLQPVPSPALAVVDGTRVRSPAAQRGERVFLATECSECHRPPLYTDRRRHDVGTGLGPDAGQGIDTPSLIEVWRTAPYLHDGRAATLREVLVDHQHPDGRATRLTPADLNDLLMFLESL